MVDSDKRHKLKEVITPHQNDVLYGRGGGTNNHFGNSQWRSIISKNKKRYIRLPKRKKMLLAQSIVLEIRQKDPPGRFLQMDPQSKLWYDVGDQKARDKTGQALREGAKHIRNEVINEDSDHSDDDLVEKKLSKLSPNSKPVAVASTTPIVVVAAAACPLSHSKHIPVKSSTSSKKTQKQKKIHTTIPQASEQRNIVQESLSTTRKRRKKQEMLPSTFPPVERECLPVSVIADPQASEKRNIVQESLSTTRKRRKKQEMLPSTSPPVEKECLPISVIANPQASEKRSIIEDSLSTSTPSKKRQKKQEKLSSVSHQVEKRCLPISVIADMQSEKLKGMKMPTPPFFPKPASSALPLPSSPENVIGQLSSTPKPSSSEVIPPMTTSMTTTTTKNETCNTEEKQKIIESISKPSSSEVIPPITTSMTTTVTKNETCNTEEKQKNIESISKPSSSKVIPPITTSMPTTVTKNETCNGEKKQKNIATGIIPDKPLSSEQRLVNEDFSEPETRAVSIEDATATTNLDLLWQASVITNHSIPQTDSSLLTRTAAVTSRLPTEISFNQQSVNTTGEELSEYSSFSQSLSSRTIPSSVVLSKNTEHLFMNDNFVEPPLGSFVSSSSYTTITTATQPSFGRSSSTFTTDSIKPTVLHTEKKLQEPKDTFSPVLNSNTDSVDIRRMSTNDYPFRETNKDNSVHTVFI